jgi:transcription elongation GreA/GreB family factor
VDKRALRDALAAVIERERDTMVEAQRLSSEGVTHADARADGTKDMRATEASYIARGQAMRAEALEADLARVRAMALRDFAADDAVALGAVVRVADGEATQVVFLAPAGGGTRLPCSEGEVHVITPQSPLGRALLGTTSGDSVEMERAGAVVEIEVVEVM